MPGSTLQLTVASYNIRKAIGLDRRRDPDRILAVLREIDADVIALQEADRRFGRRLSALPLQAIEDYTPYRPVPLHIPADGIGWHGNAILVRRNIEVIRSEPVRLPVIEPRGALRADLVIGTQQVRVVGAHLDLSGLRRRHQIRSILQHVSACDDDCPTLIMGDFNEWARHGGCFREFGRDWRVLAPGSSFPSRRPVAQLDRIVTTGHWHVHQVGVHHSALSAVGSDHLPVLARLELPKK